MENFSEYDLLVEGILKIPVLAEEIENLKKTTGAFNLITPSWLKDLESFPAYQSHKQNKSLFSNGRACGAEKKAILQSIIPRDHIFNIIVTGEFNFQKSEKYGICIIANDCAPLDLIGRAMKENDRKNLHTGARLFVKTCHPLFCSYCTKYHRENKLEITEQNWCVLGIKAFNGEEIYRCSSGMAQAALNSLKNFNAIFHMKIFNRISFGDNNYKISGRIEEMILLQKLTLNLDNFARIQYVPNYSIEYPDESNREDTVVVEHN